MAIFSAISTFVAGVATSIGIGAAAAAAIGSLATNLILSAAVSAFSRPKSRKAAIPKQLIQATINQAAGPRERVYGKQLLGGTRAFWETKGNKLHQIVLMAHGALDGEVQFWIDGAPIVIDGNGYVTSEPYNRMIRLEWRDGSGSGGDYAGVAAAFPTLWGVDHRLEGQATVYAEFTAPDVTNYNRMFPKGPLTDVQLEARGVSVLDHRTGQSVWSDNSGLCIADYLTAPDGFRIPVSKLDIDQWRAFADLSDEAVPLKDGGSEPRYRLWGVYSLQEQPKDVLERMTATCDGHIYQTPEGKVGIIGGRHSEPDVMITDADIYSLDIVEGESALTQFNVAKGIFTSADHAYQDTETAAWEDTQSLAINPEVSRDFEVVMCPANGQMQRLMKIEVGRKNRRWTGTVLTSLVGIKAMFPKGDGLHTIRLVSSEPDIDEVVEVTSFALQATPGENGVIQWRCAIGVAAVSDWYSWDALTEEKPAPSAPSTIGVEAIPVPTIAVLEEVSGPAARVTLVDIGRSDLVLEAQVRPVSSSDWDSMVVTDLSAKSAVLATGDHVVRVRFKGGGWSADSAIEMGV